MKLRKVVGLLNINVKHDEKTTTWMPTQDTYAYAHWLTGVQFDKVENALTLSEAAKKLRDFIGEYKWVVMNNDFAVIKSQLPDFASDREGPIRLKPLLATISEAKGLNSGKLQSLLSASEKETSGWNEVVKTLGDEHTGCFDALSMAVYVGMRGIVSNPGYSHGESVGK